MKQIYKDKAYTRYRNYTTIITIWDDGEIYLYDEQSLDSLLDPETLIKLIQALPQEHRKQVVDGISSNNT